MPRRNLLLLPAPTARSGCRATARLDPARLSPLRRNRRDCRAVGEGMAANAPGRRGLQAVQRPGRARPPARSSPHESVTLGAADPLLVARTHVDVLRIGSALSLPRPLTTARHS